MLQEKETVMGNGIMAKSYRRIMCETDQAATVQKAGKYFIHNLGCCTKKTDLPKFKRNLI